MITYGIVLVVVCGAYRFLVTGLKDIPAFTGYLVRNVITKKLRSIGPGWHFIIPIMEELVEPGISLKTNEHVFDAIFQTQGETAVKITIKLEEKADSGQLPAYSSFEEGKRVSGIKERVKEILDDLIRPMKDRDEVLDALEEITYVAKCEFEKERDDGKPLPQHFGTSLLSLGLFPAELPAAVVAAKAEEEAQVMKNKTEKLKAEALREIEVAAQVSKDKAQKMQGDNFRAMANELMKDAKDHGQELSFEKAYRMIQLEFGKGNLKEEIHTLGIDQGSQKTVEKIAEGVEEVLGKLAQGVLERWLAKK